MRAISTSMLTALGTALLLLASPAAEAFGHGSPHASLARRHMHSHHKKLVKRTQCEFPTDAGLVAVTPNEQNAGWAMSPDQPCKPGMYCPYACPPGRLMAQWNPQATTYSYPESMDGGLYCNEDGEIEKPFPDKPYCYDGVGTVSCKNEVGKSVAVCQTVLPGNEAMLIPTNVKSLAVLAVPDTSYWASTAAHYYINPPGISPEEGCVWGTKENPIGNWAPYVAGANENDSGETFVKIGWNPIYIEPDVPFRNVVPDWGVRIECEGGNCGGLPCYIDPNEHKVNEVSQNNAAGAGGANFCVVSVPKGATATIVVFEKDGGNSSEIEIEVGNDYDSTDEENTTSTSTPSTTSTSSKSTPTSTISATTSTLTSEEKSTSASSTSSSSSRSSAIPSSSLEYVPVTGTSTPKSTSKYGKTDNVVEPQIFANINATTTDYESSQPTAQPGSSNNFTSAPEAPIVTEANSAAAIAFSGISAMLISSIAVAFVMAL